MSPSAIRNAFPELQNINVSDREIQQKIEAVEQEFKKMKKSLRPGNLDYDAEQEYRSIHSDPTSYKKYKLVDAIRELIKYKKVMRIFNS